MFRQKLWENAQHFQRSLERIAEKYTKLQHDQEAIEVDLNDTPIYTLRQYMTLSKKKLDGLDSMSFADSQRESLQDITRDSLLNGTCKETSEDFVATSLSKVTRNDTSRDTVGPLDESQRNYSLQADQPEGQDEEMNVSRQSDGSSLGECYPDMVSQIGKAWHQQHVSEAADSVRRRYQRWRKTQMLRNNTFHVVQRQNKERSRKELFGKPHHTLRSPVRSGSSAVVKAVLQSPVKIVTISGQKSQNYCSAVRRSEATAGVMNMPAIYKESQRALNKTFAVSGPSLRLSTFTTSPPALYSPHKPVQDLSVWMKESDMSPRCMQAACSSVHGIYSSPVKSKSYKAMLTSRDIFNEQSDISGSPMRKSGVKLCASRESPQQSPYAHVASLKASPYIKQNLSKKLKRSNSTSNFALSPAKKPSVSRRMLEYPDQCVTSQQWSPQLITPRSRHLGLGHHLSFDSSSVLFSCSSATTSKDIDGDFIKLYHKFVCLNESSLNSPPCRFCTKNPEASRRFSSNLAALALSPHRSLLRKRQWELQNYPHSKRFKDGPHYF